MKAWHVLWRAAALLALAAGSLLAIMAVPLATMIALAIAAMMTIGLASRVIDEQRHVRRPLTRYLRRATPGLVIGPAVGGWIGEFGWAGTLLVAVIVASAPPLALMVVGRFRKPTSAEAPVERLAILPAERPTCPMDPTELPDEQLFHVWQLSYVLLQHARDTSEWAALVTARQLYLDELERRNPDGFRLWMASGARAASNPRRYLSSS